MPYLPTDIVAGQAGHVAHSNLAYEAVNQTRVLDRDRMINVQRPPADVSAVGAVGDDSTDDNVALQNIFDWLAGRAGNHWVFFPRINAAGNAAKYLTSKPLRVWTGTRIVGPAEIVAHPSFDWVNHPYWQHPNYRPVGNPQPNDIALMELWNDTTTRYASSRLYIDDIILNCRDQPGSIGLVTKMQQPAYTWKLRIERCTRVGWQLWGQQSDHFLLEILTCPVGLYLGPNFSGTGEFGTAGSDCKFMSFYTLNVEAYAEAAVRMDTDGPVWFQNGHFESTAALYPLPNKHVIDCRSGNFSFRNGWASMDGNTNHIFQIADKTPLPGLLKTTYMIEDFRLANTNTTGQLFINDLQRSFTRAVGLQRSIGSFRTLLQNDTEHDYDAAIEYLGDDGGTVRIGGLRGGTAADADHTGAQLTVRSNTNQDEPSVRFSAKDGTLRAGIHQSGNLFLGSYTNASRPAANTLLAGTSIWNTDDAAPNFSDGAAWRDAMGSVT